MTRLLLVVLAAYQAVNGAVMLVAPETWYAIVPDVEHTGPINVHFVRDIGLGFLAAATALVFASHGHLIALVPALVFLGGHAALHVVEMIAHGTTATAAVRDLAIIVLPALLPLVALKPTRSVPAEERA